jgi:DNA integrity scanning protein DisA with diadenylate cyclase activity
MANAIDNIVSGLDAADPSAQSTTETLLRHIAPIAESCGAAAIFVCVDVLDGHSLPLVPPAEPKVFYVTRTIVEGADSADNGAQFLRVPNVPFTRLGQVKIALFLARSRGFVKQGDKIVFLSGIASSGNLDTIIVTEVGREYEIYATSGTDPETPAHIQPQVIERVVDIASELGKEGREGKHIGALFVVGDAEHVMPLTRQLILNPFKGYPEDQRNVLDPTLEETIKELAGLDGAFIIRGDGILESCGAYLKTASQEQFELPRGLGSRHHAAAAITAVTDSIAVTVSQSTGTVTIFRGGSIITEIEKPRSLGEKPPASSTPEPAVPQKPRLARKSKNTKCA